MKSQWLLGSTVVALGLSASLSGQTTQQNVTSNTGPEGSITVIGCLQGDGGSGSGAVGTSGTTTPGATAAGGSNAGAFMLTSARARATSGASASPGATAGITRTLPSTGGNTSTGGVAAKDEGAMPGNATYVLEGKAAELREHVGQQVEITGRFSSNQSSRSASSRTSSSSDAATAGRTESGATGTAGTATGTGGDADAAGKAAGSSSSASTQPRIDVESVRTIDAPCAR